MADQLYRSYECGAHNLTYVAFKAGGPLCDSERQVTNLRAAVQELAGENDLLRGQLVTAQLQVDVVSAYRTAAVLLDDNDREFYKRVLYMFRDKSSISLKPFMSKRRIREGGSWVSRMLPVGMIVSPRQGDAWVHECTSIGGSSIALVFADSANTVGTIQATKNMVRGLAELLPGKVQ